MDRAVARLYADTSVFGGPFDEEFAEPSRALFEQVRGDRFRLVTSALVQAEIASAPPHVVQLFDDLLPLAEVVEATAEALLLRGAYVAAGIVTETSADDALHVALATIARCEIIVSWNFKHIVHFRKIPLYNAVNALRGYPSVGIFSPREVIHYENEDI